MSYVLVEGYFTISSETFNFTLYMYTTAKTLDKSKQRKRAIKHLRQYWDESQDDISSTEYDFEVTSIQVVEVAPMSLDRLESAYKHTVTATKGKSHMPGYTIEKKITIGKKGGYT